VDNDDVVAREFDEHDFPAFYVDRPKLLALWENIIPQEIRDQFAPGMRTLSSIYLAPLPQDEPVVKTGHRMSDMSLDYLDEYVILKEGQIGDLVLSISEHDVNMMPTFHVIRTHFNSRYGPYDGGGAETYVNWMAYHFLNEENFKIHYIEKRKKNWPTIWTEDNERKFWKEWRGREEKWLGKCSPLPGSEGPDDRDFERIRDWLDFTGEHIEKEKKRTGKSMLEVIRAKEKMMKKDRKTNDPPGKKGWLRWFRK